MIKTAPEFAELYSHIQRIYEINSQMFTIDEDIKSDQALIAAIDLATEENCLSFGKALPNEAARKVYKEREKQNNTTYQECLANLDQNKRIRVTLLSEKEQLRSLLELGKMQIRADQIRAEESLLQRSLAA